MVEESNLVLSIHHFPVVYGICTAAGRKGFLLEIPLLPEVLKIGLVSMSSFLLSFLVLQTLCLDAVYCVMADID